MINGKTIIGIIPARGGSKGIPRKNIKYLAGKPLLVWTIQSAKASKYIDRVFVSTDTEEIAGVSKKYCADVPFIRPKNLATDKASSESVIYHTLEWIFQNEEKKYDYFILLQPTTPLRTEKHIDESIEKIVNNAQAKSLVSICESLAHPYLMKTINDEGYLENFIGQSTRIVRRQDFPPVYQLNGAIYILRTDDFMATKSLYVKPTSYYLMNKISSIDIDDEFDFRLAEYILDSESKG